MGLIISLVIGGIVGWLASIVMKTNAQMGLIANVLVGIVGGRRPMNIAASKAEGEAALTKAIAYLDRMATKNIIHKNNAGHKKSLLVRYVAKLA
jgi:hypothetical protein